jgi:hypothetical protein
MVHTGSQALATRGRQVGLHDTLARTAWDGPESLNRGKCASREELSIYVQIVTADGGYRARARDTGGNEDAGNGSVCGDLQDNSERQCLVEGTERLKRGDSTTNNSNDDERYASRKRV